MVAQSASVRWPGRDDTRMDSAWLLSCRRRRFWASSSLVKHVVLHFCNAIERVRPQNFFVMFKKTVR